MARVLVVDDDVIVRTLLARRLRAAGFLVETAADGRAGLDSARTFGPDIVLTDWMMPEMDGPALVGALRADPALADTSVILITSRETHSRQASCEADDMLAKPWSDEELLSCLARQRRPRSLSPSPTVHTGRTAECGYERE